MLDIVIGGMLFGALYALIAVGLNLQYGVTRILNLAYGEILIIGSYITYIFFKDFGINPLLTLIVSGFVTSILGILVHIVTFRRLVLSSASAEELEFRSLFVCFGLIFLIQNLLAHMFGVTPIGTPYLTEGVDILGERFKMNTVVAAALSAAVNAVMYILLRFTKFGLAMRATAEEPIGAQIVGVNILKIHIASFSIGCLTAALAGSMISMIYSNITPYSGTIYTVIALIILVLGGRGSFVGSIVGGLIIGCAYYTMVRVRASLADPVVYILLIIMLLVRPRGLFGRK